MTVTLLPRLVPAQTERLLGQLPLRPTRGEVLTVQESQSSAVRYGPSGGQPIASGVIADLHGDLTKIAKRHGCPDGGDRTSRASFDSDAAQLLAMHPALSSGEALRDDFWGFLATVLLWKVSLWRFPVKDNQIPRHHLLGGVRNVFQRLWIRGRILDRGPEAGAERWDLLRAMSEDALVQITERPSVAANARLAKFVAEGWVRASDRVGRQKMEDVMRRAMIGIRLRNEIYVMALWADDALAEFIDKEFKRAAATLRLG